MENEEEEESDEENKEVDWICTICEKRKNI